MKYPQARNSKRTAADIKQRLHGNRKKRKLVRRQTRGRKNIKMIKSLRLLPGRLTPLSLLPASPSVREIPANLPRESSFSSAIESRSFREIAKVTERLSLSRQQQVTDFYPSRASARGPVFMTGRKFPLSRDRDL